jgi:hypothetical protein
MSNKANQIEDIKDTKLAIEIARNHEMVCESARFCREDAAHAFASGNLASANMWALKSLAHSVGICHCDYQGVASMLGLDTASGIGGRVWHWAA